MFLLGLGVDDHVVQVYQGVREVQLPQAVLHEMLERRWSIAQPIGHTQELVHTHATHREGSVLPRLLIHLNLPKPAFQVHAREMSGAHHAFHGFLHMWQGICDRLKALKGALFRSALLTRPQTRVCGFSSPEMLQTRVST